MKFVLKQLIIIMASVATMTVSFSTCPATLSSSMTTSLRDQQYNCIKLFASSSSPSNSNNNNNNNSNKDDLPRDDPKFMQDFISRAEQIAVDKERDRLEEANRQSFLKRKPRKLPYEAARRWVQANLGPDTKEEYEDLVANGNLRTPYIPKRPEEYYTETREWISWDHYLKGIFDNEQPSDIKPPTGVFD